MLSDASFVRIIKPERFEKICGHVFFIFVTKYPISQSRRTLILLRNQLQLSDNFLE